LAKIKPARVEQFKAERLKTGAKNSTVNRDLALLKTIFNKAARWGKFNGQNPVSLAGMLPENNLHVARALSEDEWLRLRDELPSETRPAIEFMLATGIRKDNVLSLKWDQVDRANRIINLPNTKSGKPLRIPLNDWAAEILEQAPRHLRSPYIFFRPCNGKRFTDLRQGFKAALVRAELDPSIRIHDLRHTCASWLAAKGVPTSVLKDLLGHSTLAMVSRYSHLGHETLLDMSNKIARPFGKDANQCANTGSGE
jgi:integrase